MAKFKPGQSGNPRGRRKGVPDRRAQARELFAQHGDELIAVPIKRALDGDSTALRLCLERVCPPIKATDAPVVLGVMPELLAEKGERVLQQLASGELSPDAARSIMPVIAQQARIIETSELERRVAALEGRTDGTE